MSWAGDGRAGTEQEDPSSAARAPIVKINLVPVASAGRAAGCTVAGSTILLTGLLLRLTAFPINAHRHPCSSQG